jgi:hypothetical protein
MFELFKAMAPLSIAGSGRSVNLMTAQPTKESVNDNDRPEARGTLMIALANPTRRPSCFLPGESTCMF